MAPSAEGAAATNRRMPRHIARVTDAGDAAGPAAVKAAAAGLYSFGRGAMDEQEQQRVARHAAVFLAWLENLPTVGRPDRGDPAVREWAEAELERLRREDGEGADR